MMASFLVTLVPALAFFLLGLFIAYFIWGLDRSDNA
jgi:hypothetical protein